MSEIIKIGLIGGMRAGKDTVANRLYYEHGFEHPIAFGDKMKRTFYDLFPQYKTEPKPRKELRKFAENAREIYPDVWIKHLENMYEYYVDRRSTSGIVLTDIRQPNEYEWARANGFIIVKVEAPAEIRKERAKRSDDFSEEDLTHSTESYTDEFAFDYSITNDGSLEDLRAKVDAIMGEIKVKEGR